MFFFFHPMWTSVSFIGPYGNVATLRSTNAVSLDCVQFYNSSPDSSIAHVDYIQWRINCVSWIHNFRPFVNFHETPITYMLIMRTFITGNIIKGWSDKLWHRQSKIEYRCFVTESSRILGTRVWNFDVLFPLIMRTFITGNIIYWWSDK